MYSDTQSALNLPSVRRMSRTEFKWLHNCEYLEIKN